MNFSTLECEFSRCVLDSLNKMKQVNEGHVVFLAPKVNV